MVGTEVGTPQGSVISPLRSNIYLHYVLDEWVSNWRKKEARGEVIIVRYAEDNVMGFQYRYGAERFLTELKERFTEYGLEIHSEKTRLIEFGRFAEINRAERGEGKPETFDFLGFTHICSRTRKGNRFTVRRQTIAKRLRAKLHEVREEIKRIRHEPIPIQGKWLRSVVQGHFNYFGVPDTARQLMRFVQRYKEGMALRLEAAESKGQRSDMGTHETPSCDVVTPSQIRAPVPRSEVSRQLPEVGAV